MKRNAFLILVLVFQVSISFGKAVTISQGEAFSTAVKFVNKIALPSSTYRVVNEPELIKDGETKIAYLFKVLPTGFVVVSTFSNANPIMAYSLDNDFATPEVEEESISFSIIRNIANTNRTKELELQTIERQVDHFEIGPFVQSLWGQVNCHDNNGYLVNVSNYYTPNHYGPGCVAISMTTLMQHYKWPISGTGSYSYTDNWGSSKGTYSADFEDTYYSWINMLNKYNNKPSTDWEREAVGLLVYQSAIALEMDFEYNGSTSNVNRIPNAGYDHFRYSSIHRYESSSVFWQLLDSNLFDEMPVVLSVEGNGYGHSVVCDGLRIEADSTMYYHLNMGWWGSANGWYRIRDDFNSGGYSSITGGVFNLAPIPALSMPVVTGTSDIVTLNWQYAPNCIADAYEVQQKIDDGSWITITNEVQDTTIDINIEPSAKYAFRVKAKYKNKWRYNSWSNEEELAYVGIGDEIGLNQVTIGPNPVNDKLIIQIPGPFENPLSLKVNSINGRLIHQGDYKSNAAIEIQTLVWKSGIYLLTVSNGQEARTFKVVKK